MCQTQGLHMHHVLKSRVTSPGTPAKAHLCPGEMRFMSRIIAALCCPSPTQMYQIKPTAIKYSNTCPTSVVWCKLARLPTRTHWPAEPLGSWEGGLSAKILKKWIQLSMFLKCVIRKWGLYQSSALPLWSGGLWISGSHCHESCLGRTFQRAPSSHPCLQSTNKQGCFQEQGLPGGWVLLTLTGRHTSSSWVVTGLHTPVVDLTHDSYFSWPSSCGHCYNQGLDAKWSLSYNSWDKQ